MEVQSNESTLQRLCFPIERKLGIRYRYKQLTDRDFNTQLFAILSTNWVVVKRTGSAETGVMAGRR